jgi:hypothetical protein
MRKVKRRKKRNPDEIVRYTTIGSFYGFAGPPMRIPITRRCQESTDRLIRTMEGHLA